MAAALLVMACGGGRDHEGCVYSVGALRFDTDELVFDTVVLGSDGVRTARVYNPTSSPVLLEQSGHLSGFRLYYEKEEVAFGGVEIPAGECGELTIVFRPDKDTLLGNYFNRLRFFVDGEGGFGEGIYVKAYVRDDFSSAGKALPKVEADMREFEFGPVREGDTVTAEFRLRNAGTVGLLIRKVETSCGCTVVEMGDRFVPPGGEKTVSVKLDTHDLFGFQRKRVALYTNDPATPVVMLVLRGNVRKSEMKQ